MLSGCVAGHSQGTQGAPEVIPVKMVACMGVPWRGCTTASQGGSSWARPSTTYTRACPSSATSKEVTIPARRPPLVVGSNTVCIIQMPLGAVENQLSREFRSTAKIGVDLVPLSN